MPWSTARQLIFASIVIVFLGVAGVASYFFFFYTPPSCSDGIQNQEEEGVDCGGPCVRMCVSPNVTALWARAVPAAPGVYHVASLIRNPDAAAAGPVTYAAFLFDENNILISTREGRLFMTAGEIVPLFIPNITTGERTPVRTFIDIESAVWERAERAEPSVRVIDWNFDTDALRLVATVENYGALPVGEVLVTALVFGESDTLIAASQTRFPSLSPRERREATFTWSMPFEGDVGRVDIIPRIVPQQ